MSTRTREKRVGITGISVYKRGNSWYYRVDLEPHSLTGQRQRANRGGFATEDEAWTNAIKAKNENGSGHRPKPAKRTVAEFLAEWLETVHDSIKPSTYANYVDYRDAYVLPNIGNRRLQDIDVPTLNALYRHLLSAGRCKRDTNTTMYEYWSTRRKAGVDPKPNEVRHEALRRIPDSVRRNSKERSWVRWLTRSRKVMGTRACHEHRRSCPDARGGASGDPRDMAKAGLLEPQSPAMQVFIHRNGV